MKVYIAQPMQYVSDQDIQTTREIAKDYICQRHGDCDVEIVNSYRPEWGMDNIPPLAALGKAFEMLAEADAAYFLPGWQNSRGCQMEWNACDMYRIPFCEIPEEVF